MNQIGWHHNVYDLQSVITRELLLWYLKIQYERLETVIKITSKSALRRTPSISHKLHSYDLLLFLSMHSCRILWIRKMTITLKMNVSFKETEAGFKMFIHCHSWVGRVIHMMPSHGNRWFFDYVWKVSDLSLNKNTNISQDTHCQCWQRELLHFCSNDFTVKFPPLLPSDVNRWNACSSEK